MHGNIAMGMKNLGPQVDHAVAAFLQDTTERGLDQDILLVITGEFGRTPRINGGAGRDHWAPLSTLALAGGGLKMGQVVGESTAKAETPKTHADRPARPDGDDLPRPRPAAGPALQRPERPAVADDRRRQADRRVGVTLEG